MNPDRNTPRLLGAAQLVVAIAAMVSGLLLMSVVGTGSTSEMLENVSSNLGLMRLSIVFELVNSSAILVLGALFYIVFYKQYRIIALVALGFYWAEGITLAVSKIGAFALMPLSLRFIEAGSPRGSYFQSMADFLYTGFIRVGYDLHMVFFCLGAVLWYYLLVRSRYIPRVLSLWGLVAVCLVSINTLLALLKPATSYLSLLLAPYIPFELVLGVWLVVKGFDPPMHASG